MDEKIVSQALDELMAISGTKYSREVAAGQVSTEALAVAKEAYAFVVNYPIDWSIRPLNDQLLDELRQALKNKYPFLEDGTVWRAGNYFAYLWK